MSKEIFVPLSEQMLADPYPVYAQLREQDPVHWHEQLDAWVVTRHDDCVRVLKQIELFSSDPRKVGQDIAASRLSLQTTDPPEQSAIRQPILAALRAVDMDEWTNDVRQVARKLLDAVGERPFDFVTEVAEPLALSAMCLLYGVPYVEDEDSFRAASRSLVLSMDTGLAPERMASGLAARDVLNELIDGWFAGDMPDGMLARVRDAEMAVPRQQMVNSMRAIFHAGYASTSSLLGNALWALAGRNQLSSDTLGTADAKMIEELVRLDSPVQAQSRSCVADVELRGRQLRRSDVVVTVLGAANHDPLVFPDPDIAHFRRNPNPQLGFGKGVHSCLGAHMAIRIVVALFHRVADRFNDVQVVGLPQRRETATLRGLAGLTVTGRLRTAPAG